MDGMDGINEMDEMEPTVKAALDTILWFEDSLTEVEAKTGELFHVLEKHNIDPEPVYEIFKVFSQIRFHMAESHEYRALLNNRQSKKRPRKSTPKPGQEELLRSLVEEHTQDVSLPQPAQALEKAQAPQPAPLHKRLESRLTALLKVPFLPLRKGQPQAGRPPPA